MAKEEKVAGQKKLTYEELLKAAQDLSAQNSYFKQQAQSMQQKIVELSNFAMFKRLDYLFEVIKNEEKFPAEFVGACRHEIVETMTPPVDEPETEAAKEE